MKIDGLQRIFDFNRSKMFLSFHLFEDRKALQISRIKEKTLYTCATHFCYTQTFWTKIVTI